MRNLFYIPIATLYFFISISYAIDSLSTRNVHAEYCFQKENNYINLKLNKEVQKIKPILSQEKI